jgi:hypothetical protein
VAATELQDLVGYTFAAFHTRCGRHAIVFERPGGPSRSVLVEELVGMRLPGLAGAVKAASVDVPGVFGMDVGVNDDFAAWAECRQLDVAFEDGARLVVLARRFGWYEGAFDPHAHPLLRNYEPPWLRETL